MVSIGTPAESRSVASIDFCNLILKISIAGSFVGPIDSLIPRSVLVRTISIGLSISEVLLLLVSDQVVKRESIMGSNEVD